MGRGGEGGGRVQSERGAGWRRGRSLGGAGRGGAVRLTQAPAAGGSTPAAERGAAGAAAVVGSGSSTGPVSALGSRRRRVRACVTGGGSGFMA